MQPEINTLLHSFLVYNELCPVYHHSCITLVFASTQCLRVQFYCIRANVYAFACVGAQVWRVQSKLTTMTTSLTPPALMPPLPSRRRVLQSRRSRAGPLRVTMTATCGGSSTVTAQTPYTNVREPDTICGDMTQGNQNSSESWRYTQKLLTAAPGSTAGNDLQQRRQGNPPRLCSIGGQLGNSVHRLYPSQCYSVHQKKYT